MLSSQLFVDSRIKKLRAREPSPRRHPFVFSDFYKPSRQITNNSFVISYSCSEYICDEECCHLAILDKASFVRKSLCTTSTCTSSSIFLRHHLPTFFFFTCFGLFFLQYLSNSLSNCIFLMCF